MGLGEGGDRSVSFNGSSFTAKSQHMYKLFIDGGKEIPTLSDSGPNIDLPAALPARYRDRG